MLNTFSNLFIISLSLVTCCKQIRKKQWILRVHILENLGTGISFNYKESVARPSLSDCVKTNAAVHLSCVYVRLLLCTFAGIPGNQLAVPGHRLSK